MPSGGYDVDELFLNCSTGDASGRFWEGVRLQNPSHLVEADNRQVCHTENGQGFCRLPWEENQIANTCGQGESCTEGSTCTVDLAQSPRFPTECRQGVVIVPVKQIS